MTVSTGVPNPAALAYLGPRLQAVYDVVTAAHLKTVQQLWPHARQAMTRQGIEKVDRIAPPTEKAAVNRFKKSITARSKPAFTRSIEEINLMPPEFMNTIIVTERIDLEAFSTFVEAGLIASKTGEAFMRSAYAYSSEQRYEVHPLFPDLETMYTFLGEFELTTEQHQDLIERIIGAYVPFGLTQDLIDEIHRMTKKDNAQTVLSAIVLRAKLTYYMTPRVERRIFSDTLKGRTYTPDEIDQIYAWGFISPQLYKLLKSLAVKKD